jgi:2-methylcitrate dehydratase PrpD
MTKDFGLEQQLAQWVVNTTFDDVPDDVVELMKTLTFVIGGCTIAGGGADGVDEVVGMINEWGGAGESTILIHGGKAPAHTAVLANSVMARAYDICEFFHPGLHVGSSVVPVAIAMAEKVGGVDGKEFLTSLAVGCELAARLGWVSQLDGFDPSGTLAVFAVAAIAGRMLRLDSKQMLHALALAFNRAAGSFQANIDASLGVRLIQAFSSQTGIECAQLAQRGLTGPARFITGLWGFYHLYCKDQAADDRLAGELGQRWDVRGMGFKNYPACGGTTGATEATLALLDRQRFTADDIASITVRMDSELTYCLVSGEFVLSDTPTVNGQFSVRYTVASAILRGFPIMEHFAPEMVVDAEVATLIKKVSVELAPSITRPGEPQGRTEVEIRLDDGTVLVESILLPTGFAAQPLSRERLVADFWSRSDFGGVPVPRDTRERFLEAVERLDELDDVRDLVPLLLARTDAPVAAS